MSEISDHARPMLARGVRLSTDKQTGEPLLLFPEGVVHLSDTAHAITQRCDGKASLGEIVKGLAAEFEVDAPTLKEDVLDCLQRLHRRKLVVFEL